MEDVKPVGIYYDPRQGKYKPVVFRSDVVALLMKGGATVDEAFEFWDFNYERSDSFVIPVDDIVTLDDIESILDDQED